MADAPVMLARDWHPEIDVDGWWWSEKFDGVRCYWTGKELLSRAGNVFAAPAWFTDKLPKIPLDGELWAGRGKFTETAGIVRHKEPHDGWRDILYKVFDAPTTAGVFEQRMDFLMGLAYRPGSPMVIVNQITLNQATLLDSLKQVEEAGGEGVMLREPRSPYIVGRSKHLLRVKSFQDDMATVLEHQPGKGKHEGRLGALLVKMENGTLFSIGIGFTDAQRENPPAIGSLVRFRYQGMTPDGIPRFPRYFGLEG